MLNNSECFVILLDKWIKPDISGAPMPPNSYFVMTKIHNARAIIFGGDIDNNVSSNVMYVVDIINSTLVSHFVRRFNFELFIHVQYWQSVYKPDSLEVLWPKERCLFDSCIINISPSPIIVIIGGVCTGDKTLKDCWILHVDKKSWTKVYHNILILHLLIK